MREKGEKALQTIRPALHTDRGDVELIDAQEGVVKVRLRGASGGCHLSLLTLARGVETTIRRIVPEIKRVEAI